MRNKIVVYSDSYCKYTKSTAFQGIIVILLIVALIALNWFWTGPIKAKKVEVPNPPQVLVDKGKYLVQTAGCARCHSTDFLDAAGARTFSFFEATLRRGKTANGEDRPKQVMPFQEFAKLTDGDVFAMYAYLFTGRLNGEQTWAEALAAYEKVRTKRQKNYKTPVCQANNKLAQDSTYMRGEYLVTTLTNCTSCHIPSSQSLPLQMGLGNKWQHYRTAESLGEHKVRGWSIPRIKDFLQKGVGGSTETTPQMALAIDKGLRYLNDFDLHAISVYLLSTPASAEQGATCERVSPEDTNKEQLLIEITSTEPAKKE